jgi:uncharacterized tellurite resistance protein B-like protein
MAKGWDVLRWLGLEPSPDDPGVLDSVSHVLDRLESGRARYVAAFAYLLGRVARADMHLGEAEMTLMARLIGEEADLTPDESQAVVALAVAEVKRFGGTHNYLVTREFAEHTTHLQRLGLLRCLFGLAAADESVGTREDNEIRGISRELGIEHGDFVRARMEVRDHLAVLRRRMAGP